MSKFNFTYTNRQILVFVIAVFVIIGTLPSLVFGFSQKQTKSNAEVTEARARMIDAKSVRKKTAKNMPKTIDSATSVAKKVADAQIVLIKQKSSTISKDSATAPTISELQSAKNVMKDNVANGSSISAWGFHNDWTVVPSISAINGANNIGVIFDVFDGSGKLMKTIQGSYSISSHVISIDNTFKTKAYNDAGVAGD